MKYLKVWKIFENESKSELGEVISREIIEDILLDITDDDEFKVVINEKSSFLEVYINNLRGDSISFYDSNSSFYWKDVKNSIIRLCEYVYLESDKTPGINSKIFNDLRNMGIKYESKAPFRIFGDGEEICIGCHKEEDFTLSDLHSFTTLRILIKPI